MSATVHYRAGTTGTYDEATSANPDSGLMRLSRWNTKKRRLEDAAVLDATCITLVEVMQNGVVKQIEFGLAKRLR